MFDGIGVTIGNTVFFVGMAVLVIGIWPWRRLWRFSVERVVAASPERVWRRYRIDLNNPESAALHDSIVSHRHIDGNPPVEELQVDTSRGRRTRMSMAQLELLDVEAPLRCCTRVRQIDDRPYPFGEQAFDSIELLPHAEGCVIAYQWQGETRTLFQFLAIRRHFQRYFERLQRIAEGGIEAVPPERRAIFWSLGISVAAVASFILWLGWRIALIMAATLVLHEFGHWLAMRITGQPSPKILLIPFFGGVAVPNHPHKSLFHDAFCSLMGPGFSALVCLVLLSIVYGTGLPYVDERGFLAYERTPQDYLVGGLCAAALAIGLLNLFQLLPVLPLDGGHVLRAVIQSIGQRVAAPLMATAGLATGAWLAYQGLYIFVILIGLGVLLAFHLRGRQPSAPRMAVWQLLIIVIGYFVTAYIHIQAAGVGFMLFERDLFPH